VFDKVILSAFDGTNVIGAAVECNDYLLSLRELFFEFRADPIGLHAGVCVTRAATFRCINSIQSKSRPFHWLFVLRKYSGKKGNGMAQPTISPPETAEGPANKGRLQRRSPSWLGGLHGDRFNLSDVFYAW